MVSYGFPLEIREAGERLFAQLQFLEPTRFSGMQCQDFLYNLFYWSNTMGLRFHVARDRMAFLERLDTSLERHQWVPYLDIGPSWLDTSSAPKNQTDDITRWFDVGKADSASSVVASYHIEAIVKKTQDRGAAAYGLRMLSSLGYESSRLVQLALGFNAELPTINVGLGETMRLRSLERFYVVDASTVAGNANRETEFREVLVPQTTP